MATASTPKIAQRLVVRTLILLFALAALFFAYQWTREKRGDYDDLVKANTVDMIAAIEYKDNGQQAVVFKADGTKVANTGYVDGSIDRDLAWTPDGQRLYFVSDREGAEPGSDVKAFNIFRWNPDANSAAARRTAGSRGRSNPSFPDEPSEDGTALITSGGNVLIFDPKDGSTRQLLPPVGREISRGSDDEGAGGASSFDTIYGQLGSSFRVAKWAKNKRYIAAIMRRDEGEILIVQDTEPNDKGNVPPPVPIAAGDRVEISVSPTDGTLYYSVMGFQWPDVRMVPAEFRVNNRVTVPFKHAIGIFDFNAPVGPVVASEDDEVAFGPPIVSPDGAELLVTVGSYADGSIQPRQLALMPARAGGGAAPAILLEAEVYEASWHPSGQRVVYIKREGGKRSIYTIEKDGSGERSISSDGEYASPIFSPQSK